MSAGRVGFAFGVDTGGSGRVPASYNGIHGLKPAPGDWRRAGLVHACRSFDTPSVFVATLDDVMAVNDLMVFGPFLAERDVSVGAVLDAHPESCHPVVRDMILSSRSHSAADAYRALYRLAEAKAATRGFRDRADVLITPTVGALVTRRAIADDPPAPNFNNGRYTNFANPQGLAGLAVPMGRSGAGDPWGVTLYAPPERASALVAVARAIAAQVRSA